MGTHPIFESDFDCLTETKRAMAAPKMVDIRNLNPQQLSEVNQRLETELQVLQNCHQELVGVKKKFITSREAVTELEGSDGAQVMDPLTYVVDFPMTLSWLSISEQIFTWRKRVQKRL